MNTYRAIVTKEGSDWLAEVPGLAGGHAYARTLTRLRQELTDAVILSDDLPDDVEVHIIFDIAADSSPALTAAFTVAHARYEADRHLTELQREQERIAREMTETGWSVRDVAGALDISPGRISQVVGPRRRKAEPSVLNQRKAATVMKRAPRKAAAKGAK